MKNKDRTKEQLLEEIEHLKAKIAQQKKSDAERKKVTTALKESEENYRAIIESITDVVFQIDTHGKFVFANEQARTLLGYNEGDGLGKSFTHFVPKREIPRYLKQLAKVIRGEEVHNFVTSVYHKDGHLVPIEISGKLIKQQGKTIGQGVVRDISLRMAAQKATRESARLLREAAQIAHLGYWDLDIVTNHLQWSDEVYKMFGIISEKFEASYEAFLKFIHPDDRERVATAFSDSLKDKTTYNVIYRIVLPSGEIKYVREKCRAEYDKNGNPVRSLGIILDITQQIDAELDLQKSRAYFQTIYNATTDAIFIHDAETGKIVDVNQSMVEMYGYDSKEEVLNLPTDQLGIGKSPYFEKEAKALLQKAKAEGPQTTEWPARHKDGHLFWVELSLRFTPIGGEKQYIASVRNIEDRKQAEKKIHHLNRVYAALSHINKAIIRIKDRNELFIQACKIAIDDGKFIMSWIGLVNSKSHKVEVVSSYGKTADYLENINIDMLDPKLRKGPTGTTIQTGKHIYSNDIETDPKMAPWCKKALSLGYKSSIALPLTIEGKTIGAYMMYSAEKDFFNEAEINLLDELASDISFALEYIEKERQRKQVEEALHESETRFRSIVEYSFEAIGLINDKFTFTYANKNLAILFGYPLEEVIGTNFKKFLASESLKLVAERYRLRQKSEKIPARYEIILLKKNGERVFAELSSSIIKDREGKAQTIVQLINVTEQKLSSEKAKDLQQHLTNTLEFMTDSFVMLDNNWNYVYVNEQAGKMFGREPESLIGKHIWTEFPEGVGQPFYKNYYKAVETRQTITMEEYYPPWDRWFENRIVPTKNGLSIFFQDVTEHRKVEQQIRQANARLKILHDLDTAILESVSVETIAQSGLQWLHQISKAIRMSIALFDEEKNRATVYSRGLLEKDIGHVQKVNLHSSFPDIAGMKNGEVIKISDLNTEKNVVKVMQRFKKEGILSFVNIPILAHGELLGSLNFGYEKPDGFTLDDLELGKEVADSLAIAMEQARLHSALKVHAKELEEKVAERTVQMEYTNNELREFAQVVSHDLKAPLRAISQLSYWLSQDYADKIDEEGQQQFKMLIGRVQRLDNLIDGILQYSRAGKVREKEKTIDLQQLVEETIRLLNVPEDMKVVVENKMPAFTGDPTRLGQLFQNLMDNAIKYMDKPRGIIKIGCVEKEEYYQFYVSDNGPGIEKKYYNRIFQIFQRLVSKDDMEGTGIGLSLVKRIVQTYGGDIWLESKLGEGTTFYFTLAVGKKEKNYEL